MQADPAGPGASACRLTVAGPVQVANSAAHVQYALITGNNEDAVTIEALVFKILKRHFAQDACYLQLVRRSK